MAEAPPISFNTSLADSLKFRALSASEELGRLFEFNVVALAESATAVDLAAMLGTKASVTLETPTAKRHLHGVVAAAGLEGTVGRRVSYRFTLRPWLWLLTRRSDTRIFQQKTVAEILRAVFQNYTGTVSFELTGSYAKYDYCVQYRETDFNFVSRLMEHEGIYYYFKHTASDHSMVICDAMSAHVAAPGFEKLPYRDSHDAMLDFAAIEQWRSQFELPPGKVALTAYDYLKPSLDLKVDASSPRSNASTALEYYDQPGEYIEKSEGNRYARLRMEELDSRYQRASGATFSVRGLAVGCLFELFEHPRTAENGKYVLVSTQMEAQYSGYESGQGQTHFECRFTAIKHGDIFRAERSTPKPIVPGPQTAVVVGPSGEEIYTDVHGRVKVQFHWDRLGQKDENSSCWLRCASPWAGKAWGMISLPRIGQEVVVDFLEGDPDQPLITGRVYNGEQIPPYLLPDHKTVSTAKSRSSSGGAAANFNELMFEDKTGEEFIRLHAEKDLIEIVKHDAHLRVDNDQFRIVTHNVTEEIGADAHLKVVGNVTHHYQGKHDLTIDGAVTTKIGGELGAKVTGAVSIATDAALSLKTGAAADIKIGANLGAEAGANVHIKGAANVVIEAGAALTLKGSMINIEASGIVSIVGSLVKINSGGGGGAGGGANPQAPGSPGSPETPQPLTDLVQQVKDDLAKSR